MQYSTALSFLAAAVATVSAQAGTTIQVAVGQNGALTYTPNNIVAAVGTAVEFSFYPKNHTVTQSSFADPCHPLAAGGFFSTFVPVDAGLSNTTFTIIVNDTKPIWLYCGQGKHCQGGMVAAINAPTTGNTFAAFLDKAKNATASTSPPGGAIGGVLKVKGAAVGSGSASGSVTVVTKTVTATISTAGGAYATTYGTTYTTAVAAAATTTSGSSSTSTAPLNATGTGAASGLKVGSGVAGAIFVAAVALL